MDRYIKSTPYNTGGYNIEELDYMVSYLIALGENVHIIYLTTKEAYLNKLNNIILNTSNISVLWHT